MAIRRSYHPALDRQRLDARRDARRFRSERTLLCSGQPEITDVVYDLFPMLAERPTALAGILSGGQQQMLAIAQALMRQPKLLMLDEPSLGLAPIVVDQVMAVLQRLRSGGTTILLVEQMVERALDIADRAYVMQTAR